MTKQAALSVRVDSDLKKSFEAFCADAGMNASVAISIFMRTVIREKKIPFEITGEYDPFYSLKNQIRLRESISQLEAGRGSVHELIPVDGEDGND